jgi:hypothetical protein
MAAWTLVPCLVSLRSEFNELAPGRDRASDGSIGDTSHGASSSDHNPDETGNTPSEDADDRNEVHAIDVDDDLRRAGWDMPRAVSIIVTRHRYGQDNRLQNVIWNRRIWSRSWGWTARAYNGPNPHDKHAHFGARYTTAQENDTRPWGLLAAQAADERKLEVAFADEKIKVTATTGKELYEPDLTAGTEVPAGKLLELAAIWARRGAVNSDTLEATLGQLVTDMAERHAETNRQLGVLSQWFETLNTPSSSPEQTAALLRAALGSQAGPVGRILATFED